MKLPIGHPLSPEGSLIKNVYGDEYIDCLGGYGIFSLGHRHEVVRIEPPLNIPEPYLVRLVEALEASLAE